MAIDLHGAQHDQPCFGEVSLLKQQEYDATKRNLLLARNIDLIEVKRSYKVNKLFEKTIDLVMNDDRPAYSVVSN